MASLWHQVILMILMVMKVVLRLVMVMMVMEVIEVMEAWCCSSCSSCLWHTSRRLHGVQDSLLRLTIMSKLAGSPYRKELNKGILMLQESGQMEMLVKKWIGLQGSECEAQQAGLIGWLSSML